LVAALQSAGAVTCSLAVGLLVTDTRAGSDASSLHQAIPASPGEHNDAQRDQRQERQSEYNRFPSAQVLSFET